MNRGWEKYHMREEEGICLDMKLRLGKHGFDLAYKCSEKYLEWAIREGEEDEDDLSTKG